MRILALDSAVARCSATLVADGVIVAGYQQDLERDQASVLPVMARNCLRDAGSTVAQIDCIAVTVGPGSFTGIRAGIALATGLGLAAGRPVVGVTVGEAMAASLPDLGGRTLWCAIPSRRGRIFLEIGDTVHSLAVTDLPTPDRPVALAGSAAADVAARLAARGADVMLTPVRLPTGTSIAQVAQQRALGLIRPLMPLPLYIDAPEARPQAANIIHSGQQ
ncbi:MAG TPA: tRNA (adenosine(37)-N6)-threonylcarbamoyltransferase complex dimerization subunit type 1 TsaB [Rhodopila sp.]|nr:tRNA (adenosine(37)-N6)-threonylcarbamoyltransferase complex dimerization subunit type 1 TsaB [Rhodopila sp.]